jgi:hypothetical protein
MIHHAQKKLSNSMVKRGEKQVSKADRLTVEAKSAGLA